MSQWPSRKAGRVLAALLRIGWGIKRESGGSHKTLERAGWPDYVWAFHDGVEIGPVMLSRIAKQTGLTPLVIRSDRTVGLTRRCTGQTLRHCLS